MRFKNFALLLLPFLMFVPNFLGVNYTPATYTLVLLGWMLIWWWSELMPMGIVALLPLVVFPMLNIASFKAIALSYADPVIFLFLGGFMLARGLEKTKLSELLAIKLLKHLGHSDKGIVMAFIIATSFVSMWVSNTATTMMMLPIALSIVSTLGKSELVKLDELKKFSFVLVLAISYSSSLGGLMTPIGTPPNVVFLAHIKEVGMTTFSFSEWMILTVPLSFTILVIMAVMMLYGPYRFSINTKNLTFENLDDVKKITNMQWVTIGVFLLAVSLWIGKDIINNFVGAQILDDNATAILVGLLLFSFPTSLKNYQPILDKSDINYLPWDMILLFGGGIALSSMMEKTGVLDLIMQALKDNAGGSSHYLQLLLLLIIVIILTEFMSNVALCAVITPIVMVWAKANHMNEMMVGLMTCMTTSFGFSLPMSTPPNALAFATGHVRFKSMIKIGFILNVLSILVVMTVGYYWMNWRLN